MDTITGRIFSLFHELCHIILKNSAFCDFRYNGSSELEIYCNRFAAAFLAPEDEVKNLGEICVTHFRNVPKYLKDSFGWELKVPIDGEVEFGPSWGEMVQLEI